MSAVLVHTWFSVTPSGHLLQAFMASVSYHIMSRDMKPQGLAEQYNVIIGEDLPSA